MADNCLNKHCDCEHVEPSKDNCLKLLELNDLKIRPAMRKISTSEWCNLQEAIRQAFYGVWCVLKNIIGFLCYIIRKLECLENKVDANIIGGFILRVGDIQYNDSVAYKLNKLQQDFQEKLFI